MVSHQVQGLKPGAFKLRVKLDSTAVQSRLGKESPYVHESVLRAAHGPRGVGGLADSLARREEMRGVEKAEKAVAELSHKRLDLIRGFVVAALRGETDDELLSRARLRVKRSDG
jgi:hypothetical protein